MVTLTALSNIGSVEIIGLIVNILMIITMWFTISRKIKRENREEMQKKLNVTSFDEYKKYHKEQHMKLETDRKEALKEVTTHIDARFEDYKTFLIKLIEK